MPACPRCQMLGWSLQGALGALSLVACHCSFARARAPPATLYFLGTEPLDREIITIPRVKRALTETPCCTPHPHLLTREDASAIALRYGHDGGCGFSCRTGCRSTVRLTLRMGGKHLFTAHLGEQGRSLV